MRKIGIYGGTFDPIHHGHLILAREASESLGLETLIFVPTAVSPHKQTRPATAQEIRVEMLQSAIKAEPNFALDLCEIHRGGPSYTIDTVQEIRLREGKAEYFFLLGDDNVSQLKTWHRFNEIRELVQFVILSRGNLETEETRYPVVRRQINISATDIRNRVASGRSIRYLVPPEVEEIIRRRQIYQEQDK